MKKVQDPGGLFPAGADAILQVRNPLQQPRVHRQAGVHLRVSVTPEHPFFDGEMLGAESSQAGQKGRDNIRALVVPNRVTDAIHGRQEYVAPAAGQVTILHAEWIGGPGVLL
ncbi:MAG: hypothetical protein ABSF98_15480 [Bryobacteraceae bacterium]